MKYQRGLGSHPKSATKLGGQTSARQDSVSSSVNEDDSGIYAEKKRAQDAAPHLGAGHVAEPSPSNVVPSPMDQKPRGTRLLPGTAVVRGPRHHPSPRSFGTPATELGIAPGLSLRAASTISDWWGSETLGSGILPSKSVLPEPSPCSGFSLLHPISGSIWTLSAASSLVCLPPAPHSAARRLS